MLRTWSRFQSRGQPRCRTPASGTLYGHRSFSLCVIVFVCFHLLEFSRYHFSFVICPMLSYIVPLLSIVLMALNIHALSLSLAWSARLSIEFKAQETIRLPVSPWTGRISILRPFLFKLLAGAVHGLVYLGSPPEAGWLKQTLRVECDRESQIVVLYVHSTEKLQLIKEI